MFGSMIKLSKERSTDEVEFSSERKTYPDFY